MTRSIWRALLPLPGAGCTHAPLRVASHFSTSVPGASLNVLATSRPGLARPAATLAAPALSRGNTAAVAVGATAADATDSSTAREAAARAKRVSAMLCGCDCGGTVGMCWGLGGGVGGEVWERGDGVTVGLGGAERASAPAVGSGAPAPKYEPPR